jgi:hypothetical protein
MRCQHITTHTSLRLLLQQWHRAGVPVVSFPCQTSLAICAQIVPTSGNPSHARLAKRHSHATLIQTMPGNHCHRVEHYMRTSPRRSTARMAWFRTITQAELARGQQKQHHPSSALRPALDDQVHGATSYVSPMLLSAQRREVNLHPPHTPHPLHTQATLLQSYPALPVLDLQAVDIISSVSARPLHRCTDALEPA